MEKREGKGEKEENSRKRDEEELIKDWVDLDGIRMKKSET